MKKHKMHIDIKAEINPSKLRFLRQINQVTPRRYSIHTFSIKVWGVSDWNPLKPLPLTCKGSLQIGDGDVHPPGQGATPWAVQLEVGETEDERVGGRLIWHGGADIEGDVGAGLWQTPHGQAQEHAAALHINLIHKQTSISIAYHSVSTIIVY